jgi:hypothetical protein
MTYEYFVSLWLVSVGVHTRMGHSRWRNPIGPGIWIRHVTLLQSGMEWSWSSKDQVESQRRDRKELVSPYVRVIRPSLIGERIVHTQYTHAAPIHDDDTQNKSEKARWNDPFLIAFFVFYRSQTPQRMPSHGHAQDNQVIRRAHARHCTKEGKTEEGTMTTLFSFKTFDALRVQ